MDVRKETKRQKEKMSVSKRKNNSGTFNVENPKRMKKIKKNVNREDPKSQSIIQEESDIKLSNGKSKVKRKRSCTDDVYEGVENHKTIKLIVPSPELSPRKSRKESRGKQVKSANSRTEMEQDGLSDGSGDHIVTKMKKHTKFVGKKTMKGQNAPVKPDWNDFKEKKKALRDKRRAADYEGDTYKVSALAKKKLESIRSKNCGAEEQIKEIKSLHSLLKGKLVSVVYAHDMSRVVQMMLKLAHKHKQTDILKNMISEIVPEIYNMSKRKYAIHVVRTMIDLAPESEKKQLVKAFQGNVMKMLTHTVGNAAIIRLYMKLKPNERHQIQRELYGGAYKLLTSEPVTSLDVIFKALPNMKETTLSNTKEHLIALFEKNAGSSSLVHAVLLDYLSHSKPEDITEMLDVVREHFQALMLSKEGVHVAMMCVWMGSAKSRKKIVKEWKGGVVPLACGEHTHLILLAILDSIDDTKLIEKIVLPELTAEDSLPTVLGSTYGRKVITYLCSRRDPALFSAPVVALLAQGDSNPHSKKNATIRASELQDMTVPVLLRHIAENTPVWMDSSANMIILLAILKCGSGGELQDALTAVAKHVVTPIQSKSKDVEVLKADDTACHLILKKLAGHDKVFHEKGLGTFGSALLQQLSDKHILSWLVNNHCCFLLLSVLQNGAPDVAQELRLKIKKLSARAWSDPKAIPVGGEKIREFLRSST